LPPQPAAATARESEGLTATGPKGGPNAINQIAGTGRPAPLEAGRGNDPIKDRLRQTVRTTIEALFEEELEAVIGRCRYRRGEGGQKGCRHGHRERQLTGTFGTGTVRVERPHRRIRPSCDRSGDCS